MTDKSQQQEAAALARIIDSFRGPRDLWRTAWGIARETGLPLSEVSAFLEGHPELFVLSPISPSGIKLYGLRERVEEYDANGAIKDDIGWGCRGRVVSGLLTTLF